MNLVRLVDRTLRSVEWWLYQLAKLSIVGMALLTTLNAIGRYLLHSPISGARDITAEVFMVVLIFLALAPIFSDDGHVRLTFVFRYFPASVRSLLNLLFDLLALVFFGLITYRYWIETTALYERGIQAIAGFGIPRMIPYSIITVGCFILFLRLLLDAIQQVCFLTGLEPEPIGSRNSDETNRTEA